ncbi:hypothetical protein EUGRSUZ_B03452 [Eucalyptus grandis]|uniref:Uncharacterized protein n=2 Tax=Eucalyptus grandis TaxID=71139 RepID=A0A059D8X7_EUCGR|nr:hypothetical protein EUGRSUZ_B03452 [Eucalyptus grandis]
MKIQVISKETIMPSSATPSPVQTYRFSLLDQLAPPFFVPVVLFYSAPDPDQDFDHVNIYEKLKTSLSECLSCFYPLAGRIKGDEHAVDLGQRAVFVRTRVNARLAKLLANPELKLVQQLLPLDPYNIQCQNALVTAIQLNLFNRGGIGIGVCISHKIADRATLSTFLSSWGAISRGASKLVAPYQDTTTIFPPREFRVPLPNNLIKKEKIVTKRFEFDSASLAALRTKAGDGSTSKSPTLIEAVTALICKAAMNARTEISGNGRSSTVISHVVNLRGRMNPPLPDHSFGNIWRFATATIKEEEDDAELHVLADHLRTAIRKIDNDYVRKLQGEDGFLWACESMREVHELMYKGDVESYRFSSWVRFPFYETDFGWGKPVWACISSVPIKNAVILMSSWSGNGLEAWVTLDEQEMAKFQSDPLLLQFVSLPYKSPKI